tara:strand:- start:30 stop:1217 length:1188 start_codon:yes stop_codon:yes gene_type:complete
MRVLIVGRQFDRGAIETLQRELACNLNKFGVKVITLNTDANPRKENAIKSNFINNGVSKVYCLDLPLNPNLFQIIGGIFRLKNIISKEKIDIIETCSESNTILAILACLGTNINQVIGLHKTFNRKKGNSIVIKELIFLFLTKIRKKIYFYAVSDWTQKAWINFSNCKFDKVKVISNSTNIKLKLKNNNEFKENFFSNLNIPKDSKLVLSIGRICYHKRQDFIIESLAPIIKQENIFIIFVGEYDLEMNESFSTIRRINYLIQKFDIESNIRFLGFRDDIKEILSISDLFVHSTLTEAFGLVLLEALRAGLPIVTSKVEAIPEIVPEPDNFLVDFDDLIGFRKCVIKSLHRSNETKKEISNRNIQYANNRKFTSIERTRQMFNYFKLILENNKNF